MSKRGNLPFSPECGQSLWYFALLNYVLVLVNMLTYLWEIRFNGTVTTMFAASAWLTYGALYTLPFALFLLVLGVFLNRPSVTYFSRGVGYKRRAFWTTSAVVLFASLQLLLFTDKSVFQVFGFHLNGFVWNLLNTKGGVESMGGATSTTQTLVLIVLGVLALEIALLVLVSRLGRFRNFLASVSTRRVLSSVLVVLFIASAFEKITYGVSSLRGHSPVMAAANVFPLYLPTTFRGLAKSLGVDVDRPPHLAVDVDSVQLNYPLKPIVRRSDVPMPNIVWFVAESLRADMLDAEIMPHSWALAQKSQWFRHHYSGGNGTRMGMFAMFYGLYGTYWFPFLQDSRGPVLMDQLIDAGYDMKMFTGAKFTYPEFDKTIFARIPSERLHEGLGMPPWTRDDANIGMMIDFLEKRDTAKPFMTFLFFEATHANYTFPEKRAIRTPYAEDLNYATMDTARHIDSIKNRYVNSCHYVDSQITRVLDYLKEHDLMKSTIVIITGDHGEEFMEKGRWGHNSEFTEEQTLTPLVMWIPGHSPQEVTRITSHLDIPATLMTQLGVTNPPDDYSQGFDLLSDVHREFTVICDWNHVAYVDGDFKAVFPMGGYAVMGQSVTTNLDLPVEDRKSFYQGHQSRIVQIMRQLKEFSR